MQVPAAPGSDEQFEMITADAADPDKPVGDREEMYKTLEQELIQQIRVSDADFSAFTQLWQCPSITQGCFF